jgi:hypothetical protein
VGLDDVFARVQRVRPHVAAELARPHAEEALLAGVVVDLADAGALDALAASLALEGVVQTVLLWGADPVTGAEDLTLASTVRRVAPGVRGAALGDVEPDLVVITDLAVGAVDASVGRPGHLAARASRGEPVPGARVAALSDQLTQHGVTATVEQVAEGIAAASLAAVALALGATLGRRAHAIALGAPSADLLNPQRDDLAAWADQAATLAAAADPLPSPLEMRVTTWLDVARRLGEVMGAERAVRRIRAHPVLAHDR